MIQMNCISVEETLKPKLLFNRYLFWVPKRQTAALQKIFLSNHAIEKVVIIILFISQYSIFDTRYRFGLAKQGFRAYVYMIWIVLLICVTYIQLNVNLVI